VDENPDRPPRAECIKPFGDLSYANLINGSHFPQDITESVTPIGKIVPPARANPVRMILVNARWQEPYTMALHPKPPARQVSYYRLSTSREGVAAAAWRRSANPVIA